MKHYAKRVASRCLPRLSRFLAAGLLGLLTACGSEDSTQSETRLLAAATVTNAQDLSVASIVKVSETRVGRTTFDYVFKVSVKNAGSGNLTGVFATLTAAGSGTTIVDGVVQVGSLTAGSTVVANDTITLRHDRSFAFNPAALSWQLNADAAPPTGTGILITGAPNAVAISLLQDYLADRPASDFPTAVDPALNATFYSNELLAVVRAGATVAEVNTALNAVGARIVASFTRNPVVSLRLPNSGTASELDAISAQLKASGAFDAVGRQFLVEPSAMPINVTPVESRNGVLLHQTAARIASAWPGPGAGAVSTSGDVELIIVDYFGADAPAAFLQALSGTANPADFNSNGLNPHGYHVLGIAAGSVGGLSDLPGKVTGVLPVSVPIHVIDSAFNATLRTPVYFINSGGTVRAVSWFVFLQSRLKEIFLANSTKRFVVNFSMGYCNGNENSVKPCIERPNHIVENDILIWRRFTDNIWPQLPATAPFDYQGKVMQVSAAGNNLGRVAAKASMWNASALLSVSLPNGILSPLTNGIVVENRQVTIPLTAGKRPTPACLSASSNKSGNIGAIGTNVYSFTGPSSAGHLSGTSMAAPQVSGLVAWMLTVRPNLAPVQLLAALRNTAYAPSATQTDPCGDAPMIDGLAALLNLDVQVSDNVFDAPTRRRLLQPNALASSPVFGFAHAREFLRHIYPSAYTSPPTVTSEADFSEYDLNGDGLIGDPSKRAPFDLRFDQSLGQKPSFDTLTRYPNGVSVTLDEKSVSDFEVLCYYVNSALYSGAQADRDAFDNELKAISTQLGRTVTCAEPAPVLLKVETTNPGWIGLPANIFLSGFQATTPLAFSIQGSPQNTCGTGERGSPIFSSAVDPAASFFSVAVVQGLPINLSGPGVNRRPCSSFFAIRTFGPGLAEQVWINATGRGQQFGGVTLDWEIQVRYSNGDQRPATFEVGKRCEVGVVANSGFFGKNFDAVCSHHLNTSVVRQ